MSWNVEFYDGVEQSILEMPVKIQARMFRLLELIEEHGANLGEPHTKSIGDGLFEIRAKAQEGIGRGLFCYLDGKNIKVLHAFVKKAQKRLKRIWILPETA
ncbi:MULTISPECIES: type II toxin-antitoxin system RelE/ParE family toxin [Vibrio]|uniref:type II toxin-antitoxin system RelE/ParE family toxin n=1 Tax=Vibrio misgurnus TaxID=2993714 RepID=UPI001F0E1BEA|nr:MULTISPECIES: type II toxin-antitoxin system RelE/ParE family toxin [unclassified Vibrio]